MGPTESGKLSPYCDSSWLYHGITGALKEVRNRPLASAEVRHCADLRPSRPVNGVVAPAAWESLLRRVWR